MQLKSRSTRFIVCAAACAACAAPPAHTAPAPAQPASIDGASSLGVAPVSVDTSEHVRTDAGEVDPPLVRPHPLDSTTAPSASGSRPMQRRFYTGKTYGSEAEFNPLTELLNEGFDVLSRTSQDRHVFRRDLGADAANVWNSLMHVGETYSQYGWSRFVRNEVLPTSLSRDGERGKWVSNYQLHLFGSGMISRRLSEWYEDHGVPHPDLFAAASLMSAHYMNEMVENDGQRTLNEDATTDLLLFDIAGIALWHADWMQRAFSGSVQLTNWPGQPSYNPSTGTLENTGQYFVLRTPIPYASQWRFFYLFGLSGVAGLTRELGNGHAISLGLGLDNNVKADSLGTRSTLRPKAGLYYDEDGSLLWSISAGGPTGVTSRLTFNAYPGALRVGSFSPGFWVQLPNAGSVRFGLVSQWGVGLGSGSAR